ncbi:MAG: hypothetical protein MPW16_13430 [Candidatus Manganitrophus sp.]|nr:MAG: hypothetical protein MPW16_13430 [Candidatus Manganitrophus sp.]
MGESKKNQGKSNPFKNTMKKLSEQFGGGDSETKIIEYEREIEETSRSSDLDGARVEGASPVAHSAGAGLQTK